MARETWTRQYLYRCSHAKHQPRVSCSLSWRQFGRAGFTLPVVALLLLLTCDDGTRGARAAAATAAATEDFELLSDPALVHRAHHLVWEKVSFNVCGKSRGARSRREEKEILTDVSGEALPGRLLAIMGPSGSGKSSLLNVLAGRVPAERHNRLEGDVSISGVPLDSFDKQRYLAYVRQQQDFYPFLTVRETLLITAGLRLDRGSSSEERDLVVNDIMDKLALSAAADTLVGDLKTPGISGGEKRRLAMALQLIGLEFPSIILLDEPTSGLDSHQALQVMETVRGLCAEGHSVIVAIHQPRSSIYALFDDVLLLADGAVLFRSTTEKALSRLAALGHKCPANYNPADFMIDLMSPVSNGTGGSGSDEHAAEAKLKTLEALAEAAARDWEKSRASGDHRTWLRFLEGVSPAGRYGRKEGGEVSRTRTVQGKGRSMALVHQPRETASSNAVLVGEEVRRRVRSGWLTQFGLLLKRSWRQATRDKFAAVARVALGLGMGGVFGSIFWKLSLAESSIQNRLSLFVNIAMNTAMFGCIRALQTLATERRVVAVERMDQGYSASAYLLSKIMAELPTDTVFPLFFGTTIYFAAGLNNPVGGIAKLAKFLGVLLVQAHASSALGLMVGCLAPSMDVANLLGPAIIVISLMLSGVHDNIPPYLKRLESASTINWGIRGIVTNEMRGVKFIPDGKPLLFGWKFDPKREVIPGEDVMDRMGFKGGDLRRPTRRLLQLTAGFHAVTLVNLFVGTPRFQRLESAQQCRDGQDTSQEQTART